VVDVDDGTELLQSRHVHVQTAGADGVPAGESDVGDAAAGDQRPEDADRGAHRADEVVVGPVRWYGGDTDGDDTGRRVVVDHAAQAAQQLGHDADVEDVGSVHQRAGAVGEQRRSHELEHAVLCPGDADVALQPGTADDPERFHGLRW